MKKWYCFAALLCAAALLAGCAPIEKQTADASSCGVAVERGLDLSDHSKEDYVLCAEENGLKLYVQPSTTAFYVETAAQEKWFSCPEDRENDWFADGIYKMEMASLMVVQYTDTSNGESSRFNTMTGSVYDNTYRLSTLESGFRVDYEFSEYNVTIPLCVYLEDGMLRVRVLLDQIEKQDGFFIRSIALLPFSAQAAKRTRAICSLPTVRAASSASTTEKYLFTVSAADLRAGAHGTAGKLRFAGCGYRCPATGLWHPSQRCRLSCRCRGICGQRPALRLHQSAADRLCQHLCGFPGHE